MDIMIIELLLYVSGIISAMCSICLLHSNRKLKNSAVIILVICILVVDCYFLDCPSQYQTEQEQAMGTLNLVADIGVVGALLVVGSIRNKNRRVKKE